MDKTKFISIRYQTDYRTYIISDDGVNIMTSYLVGDVPVERIGWVAAANFILEKNDFMAGAIQKDEETGVIDV